MTGVLATPPLLPEMLNRRKPRNWILPSLNQRWRMSEYKMCLAPWCMYPRPVPVIRPLNDNGDNKAFGVDNNSMVDRHNQDVSVNISLSMHNEVAEILSLSGACKIPATGSRCARAPPSLR